VDSWRTLNGVGWLCPDDAAERPAKAELGVVLTHGYAQETPAELGIGAAAAAALARELGRPRETADHRIVELQVATEVNVQDTVILLRGDTEALRGAAAALDGMLQDPAALEVPRLPSPRRYAWTGWGNELSAWLGMGSVALAAETDGLWSGTQEEFQRFMHRLHPGQGRRAIAWTTDRELVAAAFADPPASSIVDDPPLSWREPAPIVSGPGSIAATFQNNLLSGRLPASRTNEVALRLVARTAHRNLVQFTGLIAGLQVTVEQIGVDTLFAIRAVPHEHSTDWLAVRTALLEALDAAATFPDAVLAEEIDGAQQPESIGVDLKPAGRAINALRSGTRPTTAELVDEFDEMTVDALRNGTQLIQAASLLGVPPGDPEPGGRPLWQPSSLATVARPYLSRRSLVRLPVVPGTAQQHLRATSATLQQTLKRKKTRTAPALAARITAVDLTAVVARIDSGDTWTTVVDRENRRVTLAWPAYRRVAPLRAIVDAATPRESRIAVATDPALTANLRARLHKWRNETVIQLIAYPVLVFILVMFLATAKHYQRPVVTAVPVGNLVTLANGSTLQVSGAHWQAVTDQPRQRLTVDVSYCGGGVTVDRNTGDDARNYVAPERFEVFGIAPASRAYLPLTTGEVPLRATQLAKGQCTAGKIGFEVDAATPPPGAQIGYHNGSGDRIRWSLG
jgi:hypothetical protein